MTLSASKRNCSPLLKCPGCQKNGPLGSSKIYGKSSSITWFAHALMAIANVDMGSRLCGKGRQMTDAFTRL